MVLCCGSSRKDGKVLANLNLTGPGVSGVAGSRRPSTRQVGNGNARASHGWTGVGGMHEPRHNEPLGWYRTRCNDGSDRIATRLHASAVCYCRVEEQFARSRRDGDGERGGEKGRCFQMQASSEERESLVSGARCCAAVLRARADNQGSRRGQRAAGRLCGPGDLTWPGK